MDDINPTVIIRAITPNITMSLFSAVNTFFNRVDAAGAGSFGRFFGPVGEILGAFFYALCRLIHRLARLLDRFIDLLACPFGRALSVFLFASDRA
jgi:hypothetical protein